MRLQVGHARRHWQCSLGNIDIRLLAEGTTGLLPVMSSHESRPAATVYHLFCVLKEMMTNVSK